MFVRHKKLPLLGYAHVSALCLYWVDCERQEDEPASSTTSYLYRPSIRHKQLRASTYTNVLNTWIDFAIFRHVCAVCWHREDSIVLLYWLRLSIPSQINNFLLAGVVPERPSRGEKSAVRAPNDQSLKLVGCHTGTRPGIQQLEQVGCSPATCVHRRTLRDQARIIDIWAT